MGKTLLLADDSVVIQKLVGLSFANEDVEIVSTDNGDDAVAKAREVRPDVVLADVVMPGKSGYEVCEAIKQDPELAHTPVLLLTGTFEAFDESRATAAGADGHITKPFEAQALVERVKAVIKNAVRPAPAPAAPARPAAPAAAASGNTAPGAGLGPIAARSAGVLPADDLFDDADGSSAPTAARASLFGRVESLDVTPNLSEEDLDEALDVDLFGPPGDVGGPSFGAPAAPPLPPQAASEADATRVVDLPLVEDTTIALLDPTGGAASSQRDAAAIDDLGFDDPLEVPELPISAFDLDTAFDADPTDVRPPSFQVARDDANAATSKSFGRAAVTDLDELLAAPTAAPAGFGDRSSIPQQPEAPTIVDLGPAERGSADVDFGFDVSEQAPPPVPDRLEESFSSLLDVSESQRIGDATPVPWPSSPAVAEEEAPPLAWIESPAFAAEAGAPHAAAASANAFDVSSSDLATAGPPFDAPPAMPLAADAPPRDAAVSHLSPILQQQVQETLEKVAWEAFSDLSETIVKQVIERVERIAWEVIPQMAETLVREEIRKMKGDED